MDAKQKLAYERDNLLKQVVQLRKEITEAASRQQTADAAKARLEAEMDQLKVALLLLSVSRHLLRQASVESKQGEIEREMRKKARAVCGTVSYLTAPRPVWSAS